MDGTQIPTNIPKSLLSGLSIKKKRYIENVKDKNVAINTYTVDLSILPQNLFYVCKNSLKNKTYYYPFGNFYLAFAKSTSVYTH